MAWEDGEVYMTMLKRLHILFIFCLRSHDSIFVYVLLQYTIIMRLLLLDLEEVV
jgi:hypothetical protein